MSERPTICLHPCRTCGANACHPLGEGCSQASEYCACEARAEQVNP